MSLGHTGALAVIKAHELSEALNLTDAPRSLKERAQRAVLEAIELSDAIKGWETKTRSDQQK